MGIGDFLGVKKSESSTTKRASVNQPAIDPKLKDILANIREYAQTKGGMPDALNNILTAIAADDFGAVYWICRSFPTMHYGFLVSDMGYVGLSERYVPKLLYPGDIAIYSLPLEIKSGDVVELINYAPLPTDPSKNAVSFYHFIVESFNTNGSVNVRSPFPDKKLAAVIKSQILGKFVKSYELGTKEWKEMFNKFGNQDYYKKNTKEILEQMIANTEPTWFSTAAEKNKIVSEMKKRLVALK